jgi:serine O-acetyltransferase
VNVSVKINGNHHFETGTSSELTVVVDALTAATIDLVGKRPRQARALPERDTLEHIVADLRAVLFPVHFGPPDLSADGIRFYIGHRLDAALRQLQEQIHRGLLFECEHPHQPCELCAARAGELTRAFAQQLPVVRALLGSDVRAAYDGDPAARSLDEAIFCYPGIAAVIHHRLAHELYGLGVPLIPRIISELAHAATGIDIHPGAQIGGSFFIDHGTGVVIGETSVIGERVCLYQGVTLGARSFPTDSDGRAIKGRPRHPIVQDDVIIYAGATILGRITIGRGSSIGGNVWLTRGVPAGSRITQAQVRDDLFDGGSGI